MLSNLGWDDIIALPELRTLTVVEGLVFPSKVKTYIAKAMVDVTEVQTYELDQH